MPQNPSNDPIEEWNEWQEHQYNPGYWINRIPPHLRRLRPSRGLMVILGIQAVLFLAAMVALWLNFFFSVSWRNLGLALFVSAFGGIVLRHIIVFRPRKQPKPQALIEKENRERKKEERDLPKRRKDYR